METSRNRTEQALMARGLDNHTARQLRDAGHTLASLLQDDTDRLREFKVSESVIATFYAGNRPSIPPMVLRTVLHENRWTCCVCRDTALPVVVHHIKEWAGSRDHSKENLAVLCSVHHGEAHNKRGLEISLTPTRLKQQKKQWETFCKQDDLRISLKNSDARLSTWFYFNHLRIYEIAKSVGVNFKTLPGYADLIALGSCTKEGSLLKSIPKDGYMYDGIDRIPLYDYVSGMYFSVVRKTGLINVSDHLDRSFVPQIILGDIILVQGMHTFSPVSKRRYAPDVSEVWRKANGVRISCQVNLGEATSSSSWSTWLRGQHEVATILVVRKIFRQDGLVHIEGTALAIRDPDDELKKRSYLQRLIESGMQMREEGDGSEIEDGTLKKSPT